MCRRAGQPHRLEQLLLSTALYSFPAALSAQARYSGFGRIWRVPMTFVVDRQGRLRDDLMRDTLLLDETFLEQRVAPLLEP